MVDTTQTKQVKYFYRVVFVTTFSLFFIYMYKDNLWISLGIGTSLVILLVFLFRQFNKYNEKEDFVYNLRHKEPIDKVIKENEVELGRRFSFNNSLVTIQPKTKRPILTIYLNTKSKVSLEERVHLTMWLQGISKEIGKNKFLYRVVVNGKKIKFAYIKEQETQ